MEGFALAAAFEFRYTKTGPITFFHASPCPNLIAKSSPA